MVNVIDHKIRSSINISVSEYIVIDTCSQMYPLMIGTGINYLSEVTGIPSGTIKQAMNSLIDRGLLEKKDNGYYYPSRKWYIALSGEPVVANDTSENTAKHVIQFFNELNGTKYHVQSSLDLIKKIVKSNPKISIDHFESVIVHKHETWGRDEKMREYNRPSTLFSSKFIKYLDDANNYWINKEKNDTSTAIIRNIG